MEFRTQPRIVRLIWLYLVLAFLWAVVTVHWTLALVSVATLLVSMAPAALAARLDLKLPVSLVVAIVIFIFSTLFLGEAADFYNRYWWWDVVMHGGSAIAFGMIGFLFIFFLFEGDRYAAPPIAMAFIAFCFAVTIGALWEIFEFTMDRTFGLNMQKSGLVDTMADLIVDVVGATIGAGVGFFYLKGREIGGFDRMIADFVRKNKRLFRKFK